MDGRTVEALKADGEWFQAGMLAAWLGHTSAYGCHYGMRSTLEKARAEFARGWNEYHTTRPPAKVESLALDARAIIASAERAGLVVDDGNVIDLLADNLDASLATLRAVLAVAYPGRFPRAEG